LFPFKEILCDIQTLKKKGTIPLTFTGLAFTKILSIPQREEILENHKYYWVIGGEIEVFSVFIRSLF
jgi:hypothetical protein